MNKQRVTHLERSEIEGSSIHLSHLFSYVSAYVYSREMCEELADMIEFALEEAKSTGQLQVVDQDGECCFHVSPTGYIKLMLPWKTYKVCKKDNIIITTGDAPVPPKPPTPPYQSFQAMAQGAMVDGSVEVFPINSNNHGTMMCIGTEFGPVYITKEQAKTFFDLKDK